MSDRDLFNEWAAEALMDHDEQAAYEASRNVDLGLDCGWVSNAEMQARWAADRAAVESESHKAHVAELAEKTRWRETGAA